MRFWDTSAIIPLLVREPSSAALKVERGLDREMIVWWGTQVECTSTIARLERIGELTSGRVTVALDRFDALRRTWDEVEPAEVVRTRARRLLRVHPLRAADALQLAAALAAAEGRPDALPFVCLDGRLNGAAEREGFEIVDPS